MVTDSMILKSVTVGFIIAIWKKRRKELAIPGLRYAWV